MSTRIRNEYEAFDHAFNVYCEDFYPAEYVADLRQQIEKSDDMCFKLSLMQEIYKTLNPHELSTWYQFFGLLSNFDSVEVQ